MNIKCLSLILVLIMSGCGYSSIRNEVAGQVKKVVHNTPLLCPNYDDVDLSLGVMKDGVGSMSTQDQWFLVDDPKLLAVLKEANETGQLVKVKYDVLRITFCVDDHVLTDVQIMK